MIVRSFAGTQVPAPAVVLLALLAWAAGCRKGEPGVTEEPVSSRSYKGHENDLDANNLVGAYPALVGTRLDDCQTCHAGRMEEGRLAGSSCDHCHDLLLHGTGHQARATLNPFGLDYLDAGRSLEALALIGEADSDADGFSNREELTAQRYPGSALSRPGQAVAAIRTLTLEALKALPSHAQFMLANTTQQQFDDYATFRGVKVLDLLESLSVDLSGATGITVVAADGYMKSFPLRQVLEPFPQGSFHAGLGPETLGDACGFVRYPESLPEGVAADRLIPGEPWLLLGYEREGVALDTAALDVAEGRIVGEGPVRVVAPQLRPGMPDRGSRYSPSGCGDGMDFREDADHNAGAMVRGVVAIRVDPMPSGVEEFDVAHGGWAYVDAGEIIVYGHGVR